MLLRLYIWFLIWFYKTLNGYTKVSVKAIFAQAAHETGNFKSVVFKENKNLFGMRLAKVRDNVANGERYLHATYKTLYHSVSDYFKRQKYFGIPDVADNEYIDSTVLSNYAEDIDYRKKWLDWVDRLKTGFFDNTFYVAFFLQY